MTVELKVGMSCQGCVGAVKRVLGKMEVLSCSIYDHIICNNFPIELFPRRFSLCEIDVIQCSSSTAYEDGKFCETFHLSASGWRCCESCGKQIHCGCIVSFHMFVLLDAGGIECLTCAKKSYILTPNPAWPPPSHFLPSQPEKMKDLSAKSWSAVSGSGLMPWHQAPNLFNGCDTQSNNVHKKMPFEINASGSIDRYRIGDRLSTISLEMKQQRYERLAPGKLRLGSSETPQNGNAGINMREQSYAFLNDFKPVFRQNDSSSSNLSLATASSSKIEADETQLPATLSQPQGCTIPSGKQGNHIGMDSPCEVHIRNGKARGRNQLLTRYRPQITNEELQQISSDSKSVITPLFEKMLSASDAGRIGRLVLPKKCAEAYFPPITQPEGQPLKVQDMKGKEWVFQFRFWPNNNSRMYVLEGITPCIQSLQLQAGDVVTFSRLQPEGKLVMGGRKASAILSSDQGEETPIMGSDASTPGESSARNNYGDAISVNGYMKEKILEDKPQSLKRKNGNFAVKNKRLRLDSEDVTELKITWKEAQGLMRPPANIVPSVVVVEGCEFEEFEEASPVIGRPTIPALDHFGEKIQWLQCEDCFKWRKVPADALLSSRWTCAENVWDTNKSRCSAAEELTKEQLDNMLLTMSSSKKEDTTDADQDMDVFVTLEGLDSLVNLAIQEEGDGCHAENRTKDPDHNQPCPCILCWEPPSGKGPKHKQSCECVACSSLRRRFKTLMERHEKKQSEKEAQPSLQNSQQVIRKVQDVNSYPGTSTLNKDGSKSTKSSHSPLKGQIDLNIQPEREESSPGSDPGHMDYTHPGPAGRFFRQQGSVGSDAIGDLIGTQTQQEGIGGGGTGFINCVSLDSSNKRTVYIDRQHPHGS